MKEGLRLGWYGEAVGDAAIAFWVELYALGQTFMVWHGFWSRCNSKGTKAKHSGHETEGNEVFHGLMREMQMEAVPCPERAMREKLP